MMKKIMLAPVSIVLIISLTLFGACFTTTDSGDSSSSEAPSKKGFESKTVFYLDCADVPTFGAFIEENTITFETDGTFSNNYDFTPAGSVAGPTVFPSYDGEYEISEDGTKIIFTEPWKGHGNQSYTEEEFDPEKIITREYDLIILESGGMKFTRIYNETLAMPYYTNAEDFESLKEFEYPAALGEMVVFGKAEIFVGDVKNVPISEDLGTLAAITMECFDDGSYVLTLELKGSDGMSVAVKSKGGYKLDDATAPTTITVLEDGKTETASFNMAEQGEEGDEYLIITYISNAFGTIILYSDVNKIPVGGPSAGWIAARVGTIEAYNPYEAETSFTVTVRANPSMTATFVFKRDGSWSMMMYGSPVGSGYYNLSNGNIVIEDGGNVQQCAFDEDGNFVWKHGTLGDCDCVKVV